MSTLLFFLLVMLQAAAATKTIRRPDYAKDTGLPDEVLTKYEKSNLLYRLLMEKDPYYAKTPPYLEKAKEIDEKFGRQKGWIVKPNEEKRIVKTLGRQVQSPQPWETYDSFARRNPTHKRLAPIPFIDKANARREAANKYYGQMNPPGLVHWPQAAPKSLRDAEKYAIGHAKHLRILENGGVRAAINSDNPSLIGATFQNYGDIERWAPARTKWEKAEMMKNSQRIAEAFKWDRIKDKLSDTNNHIMAQLKAAKNYLPQEFKIQRQNAVKEMKRIATTHGRYGPNEMHAERNKLFRREQVPGHAITAAWLSSMLLEKGMEGHWPHIDDKDNRHYGVPSPWAGGNYNPIQSTFNRHGPFRSWQPNPLSYKCIGAVYGSKDSEGCFTNNQEGASWGSLPQQHTLSHPAEYQIADGMQFSQENRDNLRRKWIKAGTSRHEIEQAAEKGRQDEEEFEYPHRWSAFRRDDLPPIKQKRDKKGSSEESDPAAWANEHSSVFTNIVQATAPLSMNWNLQFVQDHEFAQPKTLGAFIRQNKDKKRGFIPFKSPPPNLQKSPDYPTLDRDLRHPDPSESGILTNPMAGLVYEVEYRLRDPRATYKKTYGSNKQGLHAADPGIPDIIIEGRLICFGDVGAEDAQISLMTGDLVHNKDVKHISSAFTDKEGRFKLETTMDFAPHKLFVEFFHQCKESRNEKMDGKGESGYTRLALKYGDRRVYDLGTVDSSEHKYHWKRERRQIEGVDYQGDELTPDMARMRPCFNTMDPSFCTDDLAFDEQEGQSDLNNEEDIKEGENQLGLDKDLPQYVASVVRN